VTQDELDQAAQTYEAAAAELERARGHCLVAAERFRNGEVPSGTAHAWAAHGHVVKAAQRLDDQAVQHTGKAMLEGD
jgi:hypothetical protein